MLIALQALEVQDQRDTGIGFIPGLAPWLVGGRLLTVLSRGLMCPHAARPTGGGPPQGSHFNLTC